MITLGDIKNDVGDACGMISGDNPKVANYINRAQEILLNATESIGSVFRYRVLVENGYITWPRNILTIEAISVDSVPYTIRNQWFEYGDNAIGDMDIDEGRAMSKMMVDRGNAVVFSDIVSTGNPKRLKVVSDVAETSKRILLMGYDENGKWIRTLDGTTYVDGEYVDISTTGGTSLSFFSSITRIIKDETNSDVSLYEVDSVTSTERLIGIYQWDETKPEYRRSQIIGLDSSATVTVMAKLRSIDVHSDNDFLVVQSREAIIDMCRALYQKRANFEEYKSLYDSAVKEASKALRRYRGTGAGVTMKFINKNAFAGNRNLI